MAEEFTRLVDSMGELRVADGTSSLYGLNFNRPRPNQIAVVQSIQKLIQSAEATATHAQQVESSDIAQLSSLRRRASALARVTKTFSDATERYIIAYITSLAGPNVLVRDILSHFDDKLRSIIQDVLNSTSDDSNVLREILEMCHNQALDTSGSLHSDNYFILQAEARSGWPFDPEYYDHINRLDVDDSYTEAFRVRCERESEKERQQKEGWIRFWVQGLSKCPNGPTLFYPAASRLPQCHLSDVPRYLFRAFDHKSTGRNDHNVIASTESISMNSRSSRADLLSRTGEEAAIMLYRHLTKPCFEENDERGNVDNLMSWSSSLLFVIQYATWRCYKRHCTPAEVEICMVDTTKFPHGQFARDMSLIRAYRGSPQLAQEIRDFFNFRLKRKYYDNGEYLSQGVLHHTGRSVVVSLSQLIEAGLYDLYPEFADSAEMSSWTKRVGALRSGWSTEHTTTESDIKRASNIATACFHSFNTPDVALLLLSFKNRKLRTSTTTGTFQFSKITIAKRSFSKVLERRGDPNDFGPDEVQRYMEIAETMTPNRQDDCNSSSLLSVYDTFC